MRSRASLFPWSILTAGNWAQPRSAGLPRRTPRPGTAASDWCRVESVNKPVDQA